MKWVKWSCGGCGRMNYSRTSTLPPPPEVTTETCPSCGGSGNGFWEERQPPDSTVTAEELFWQCPSCGHDNEIPSVRAAATLETCSKCERECGVLWLGTWDGPLGSFEV